MDHRLVHRGPAARVQQKQWYEQIDKKRLGRNGIYGGIMGCVMGFGFGYSQEWQLLSWKALQRRSTCWRLVEHSAPHSASCPWNKLCLWRLLFTISNGFLRCNKVPKCTNRFGTVCCLWGSCYHAISKGAIFTKKFAVCSYLIGLDAFLGIVTNTFEAMTDEGSIFIFVWFNCTNI